MATKTSIASNALIRLGHKPINSLDDVTTPGSLKATEVANSLWPTVRDSLLRSHPWNCATARTALSPLTQKPAYGYDNQFLLPGEWLRNVEINGSASEAIDHVVETFNGQSVLLMDTTECRLRYVWCNDSVSRWDPMLVLCAELAMAYHMAYAFTQSTEREQALRAALFEELKKARSVDGQDASPATFGSFEVLGARLNP